MLFVCHVADKLRLSVPSVGELSEVVRDNAQVCFVRAEAACFSGRRYASADDFLVWQWLVEHGQFESHFLITTLIN